MPPANETQKTQSLEQIDPFERYELAKANAKSQEEINFALMVLESALEDGQD